MTPMQRNVCAPANPHMVVRGHMVQKLLQRHHTPRSAKQSAVHAHAHHFGAVQSGWVTFGVQRIKAVAQVDEKIIRLCKALR